jgi:hypothetical protein
MLKNLFSRGRVLRSATATIALLGSCLPAHAFTEQFDNGVSVRLDNTIEYSVIERVAPENSYYNTAAAINANDGDNNLRAGIVSNRIDAITEFSITDNGFGFDASADSFYDTVYNQKTQNGTRTYNPAQQPADKFTSATQTQSGRNIELRNLFIFGSQTIGNIPVSLRVGRLVNLWGESLFNATNGISYGQAPLNPNEAASEPNTQAKNIYLPVGQVDISASLTDSISISGYYEFEWEKYNSKPEGSFLGQSDILDAGGERLAAAPHAGGEAYFYRGADISGADTGQFGISMHYDPVGSNYDFGLYALQYNDTEPQVYTYVHLGAHGPIYTLEPSAPGQPTAYSFGTYRLVYANHIQLYGASTSTTIGPLNLAGEASVRTNDDLNSTVSVSPAQAAHADNSNDPLYATGNTLHYQVNEIYLGPKGPFWDGSSVLGEFGGVNLFAFDKNRENFNRAYRKMGLGGRILATLNYYEVLPGLNVNPSIGFGWNFMGKAPDTVVFNNSTADRAGDITFGMSLSYLAVWTGGISYTRYIGSPELTTLSDRDFVQFNVERTF